MTYFWPGGIPIKVQVDPSGRPLSIVWNGKSHRVDRVSVGKLLDDRWWVARVWRAYYRVITASGLLLVIFRNLITNTWYLERLYD